jgi:hypothetical protein
MAHFILEITPYKASGQDIFVATGKGDTTHGSSHTRTFYDKQSLIEQARAVHMPLSQSDKASLFNGEAIRLIADDLGQVPITCVKSELNLFGALCNPLYPQIRIAS